MYSSVTSSSVENFTRVFFFGFLYNVGYVRFRLKNWKQFVFTTRHTNDSDWKRKTNWLRIRLCRKNLKFVLLNSEIEISDIGDDSNETTNSNSDHDENLIAKHFSFCASFIFGWFCAGFALNDSCRYEMKSKLELELNFDAKNAIHSNCGWRRHLRCNRLFHFKCLIGVTATLMIIWNSLHAREYCSRISKALFVFIFAFCSFVVAFNFFFFFGRHRKERNETEIFCPLLFLHFLSLIFSSLLRRLVFASFIFISSFTK